MKKLTALETKLFNRLKACHLAIDKATDEMHDAMQKGEVKKKNANAFEILTGELSETESLIKSIEDYKKPIEGSLKHAMEKVSIEMIEALDYGEEKPLNANYIIYHYSESDVIVINDIHEWAEKLQVLRDGDNLIFEEL